MSEVNKAPTSAPTQSNSPVSANTEKIEQSNGSNQLESGEQSIVKPQKKKFKYKADGAEVEEELDDSEIANRLALARGANKRMQEAAITRKQTEQLLTKLKDNPIEVLNDDRIMGQKKFREIAENFLIEQIKLEQMSPEQKAQLDQQKELERYKNEEKLRKEDEEKQKSATLEKQYVEKFEKTIIDALQSSNLPKNTKTVSRMAQLLQLSIKNGLEADAPMLAQMARDEYSGDLRALVNDMNAEQIIAFLGDDVSNKLRKHDLSKFVPKNPVPIKPSVQQNESPMTKKLSPREFEEQLRNKFKK